MSSCWAPALRQVWNPAFDVTPADLIAGIITEQGPVPKSAAGSFLVSKVLGQSSCESTAQANGTARPVNGQAPAQNGADSRDGAGFVALDVHTVTNYLAGVPHLASQLGPAGSAQQWKVCCTEQAHHCFVLCSCARHSMLTMALLLL